MKFTLTAADTMASVLQSMTPVTGVTQKQSYSAYGDTIQSANDVQIPGFNGERRDPLTGTTHLGNGYRPYNPTLMRFHAPDSMSPFGAGGLNCYAYCSGDPINNSDPSGHMSAQAGVGIGLGVLGLVMGKATFGVSIAAKVAVVASVSAIATGIASAATENSNPEASAVLGWVSLATGVAGAVTAGRAAKVNHNRQRTKRRYGTQYLGISDGNPSFAIPQVSSDSRKQRLNIVAHGEPGIAVINGIQMDGDMLFKHLNEHVYDIGRFDEFRLMICHSADIPDGGGKSLARALADNFGKDVVGFNGIITTTDNQTFAQQARGIIQNSNSEGAHKQLKKLVFKMQPSSYVEREPFTYDDGLHSDYHPRRFKPSAR
ncbi:RHS repeat-associated core domain [Serratia quinivorans]|jgi:RHS repeat-associated protein|uniref:RHS repeat-associated core domain-containing protein n=1 Tax=Serratia quinivorans TaxID=137545 RepID=A0ABV3UKD8_9GAMM|nr:RHS repeat-associated core domain-containing protein [Serratia quinivorans]CAI1564157.1 RHS repeat-associated core domain [Serratia quinivorans]CAI1699211.1 RHS repeat-associated core domain [Serratia quinivorans]CAI1721316.1 RHS repeat-associated core domain [Serratia quinivorans]